MHQNLVPLQKNFSQQLENRSHQSKGFLNVFSNGELPEYEVFIILFLGGTDKTSTREKKEKKKESLTRASSCCTRGVVCASLFSHPRMAQ